VVFIGVVDEVMHDEVCCDDDVDPQMGAHDQGAEWPGLNIWHPSEPNLDSKEKRGSLMRFSCFKFMPFAKLADKRVFHVQ
jgi:hypothetical protein